jgi:hypothetical protein
LLYKIRKGIHISPLRHATSCGTVPFHAKGTYSFLLQVDVFFSRDLDSRISAREVAAVQQFLSSDKTVSINKKAI